MSDPTDVVTGLINRVIEREGGYVNHPADRGGATKFGITQGTLDAWLNDEHTKDVVHLTLDEARQIYQTKYWDVPGFYKLDVGPRTTELLFDTAVHSGPVQAVKLLQGVLDVKRDGLIGPITRGAAQEYEDRRLFVLLLAKRYEFLANLVAVDPSQSVFMRGWIKRLNELLVEQTV